MFGVRCLCCLVWLCVALCWFDLLGRLHYADLMLWLVDAFCFVLNWIVLCCCVSCVVVLLLCVLLCIVRVVVCYGACVAVSVLWCGGLLLCC